MNDVFRQEYTPVSPEVSKSMIDVKVKAQELYDLIDAVNTPHCDQRMIALGRTNLEQAVMWTIKGMSAKPKTE